MTSRREMRDDVAEEIKAALREHGETDNSMLAELVGQSTDLTRSVCAELALSGAVICRQTARMFWRLEGQRADREALELLRLCRARGVTCEVAIARGEPRARVAHPAGDGWVWIDSAEDLNWLLIDRGVLEEVAA